MYHNLWCKGIIAIIKGALYMMVLMLKCKDTDCNILFMQLSNYCIPCQCYVNKYKRLFELFIAWWESESVPVCIITWMAWFAWRDHFFSKWYVKQSLESTSIWIFRLIVPHEIRVCSGSILQWASLLMDNKGRQVFLLVMQTVWKLFCPHNVYDIPIGITLGLGPQSLDNN